MTRPIACLALLLLPAALIASSPPAPILREIASDVGLHFEHVTGATGDHYMPEIMGAGAALFDYDNDGDLDVYLVQGRPLDAGKTLLFPPHESSNTGNRLFRNMLIESGALRFEDVTEKAGVGHDGYGMGAATGDYDNDGFLDLYVTNFGDNVLYHNNGDGTFTDVTRVAGVAVGRWSTSASFVDYDNDGLLDLFVGNYVDFTVQGNKRCFAPTGEPDYCTPMAYKAVPSRLFHNLGNGTFADVTDASGIGASYGPALGVVAADLNGDGRTDIYVANDTAANRLWLNRGDGTFKEIGARGRRGLRHQRPHQGRHGRDCRASRRSGHGGDAGDKPDARRRHALPRLERHLRGRVLAIRPGGTDVRLHRVRHAVARFRQRRTARPLHRQRRGHHRRITARLAVPLSSAQSPVP